MHKFYELCKYIALQLPKRMPDDAGGYNTIWENKLFVWAKVEPINPSSGAKGIKKLKPWKYKIITRFDKRINKEMRIIYQNQVMRIDEIINVDEKNCFLEIFVIKEG